MPQMSPINWLFLFMVFSLIFIMFNIMNFYAFLPPSPKSSQTKKSVKPLIWKW
uniref:ATP synthase complex subunit 8 n=2 Tax=Eremoneura TaxID=480118 RepID=A0A8A5M7M3_9DIOP|nr:ATP synthase F0 subunit 8 [Nothybus sumatranus]QQV73781.1 ATP synthase F0 subunit 8 [Syneches medoganus]QTF87880.1 ATP synthase F0 subunit 8 [Nothybus sumatranus]